MAMQVLPSGSSTPLAVRPWSKARQALIDGVKAYAVEHYEDGWDTIVECWDDPQIFEATKSCRTIAGAVKELSGVVSVWKDQQDDARNSSF